MVPGLLGLVHPVILVLLAHVVHDPPPLDDVLPEPPQQLPQSVPPVGRTLAEQTYRLPQLSEILLHIRVACGHVDGLDLPPPLELLQHGHLVLGHDLLVHGDVLVGHLDVVIVPCLDAVPVNGSKVYNLLSFDILELVVRHDRSMASLRPSLKSMQVFLRVILCFISFLMWKFLTIFYGNIFDLNMFINHSLKHTETEHL